MPWQEKCGQWRASIHFDGKNHVSPRFSTKTAAKNWAIEKRLDLKEEKQRKDNKDFTMVYIIDLFLQPQSHRGKREATVKKLRFALQHWLKYFEEKELTYISELRNIHLSDYQNWRKAQITPRKRPPSNTTINHELKAISQCFKWASWELQFSNPFPEVRLIKIPKADRPKYLTVEQISIIEEAAKKDSRKQSFYEAFVILVRTGMRSGEVCQLEVCDIHFDRDQIILPARKTKSSCERFIPITPSLKPFLQKLVHRAIDNDELLLLQTANGNPQNPSNLYHRFRSLLEDLKAEGKIDDIENINVHVLRKTYISHMVMNGVNPVKVMTIVGHKEFSTMRRYLYLTPEFSTENVDVLKY